MQNIVTNLGEESRKYLTEGLREFKKIESARALEVGYLNRCMGKNFEARKAKVPELCPEVTVRESSDELTLRAEDVGTLKTYINVNHIEEERWGHPLVDYDWYAFCQAYKGIEGEDWGEMYEPTGVKKPKEAQKAKALRKMKAAKDAGEEYYDPTREDNIKGRSETILALWEEHLKSPIVAQDKALKCVEYSN